jgi:hypothetical protein
VKQVMSNLLPPDHSSSGEPMNESGGDGADPNEGRHWIDASWTHASFAGLRGPDEITTVVRSGGYSVASLNVSR